MNDAQTTRREVRMSKKSKMPRTYRSLSWENSIPFCQWCWQLCWENIWETCDGCSGRSCAIWPEGSMSRPDMAQHIYQKRWLSALVYFTWFQRTCGLCKLFFLKNVTTSMLLKSNFLTYLRSSDDNVANFRFHQVQMVILNCILFRGITRYEWRSHSRILNPNFFWACPVRPFWAPFKRLGRGLERGPLMCLQYQGRSEYLVDGLLHFSYLPFRELWHCPENLCYSNVPIPERLFRPLFVRPFCQFWQLLLPCRWTSPRGLFADILI